ncbi:MAG TPA: hypothetical protein VHR39_17360 [Propionibacteriaceae bacterium]|nr:hypothetical protein [Propionibacteriaceae bacterium]
MPAPDTLTRRRERIAGIHGPSIDTIELSEGNMMRVVVTGGTGRAGRWVVRLLAEVGDA